jgi:outer membrane protein assembly factor BamB
MVYVITTGFQFGAVDLRSGGFVPIGLGLPPFVGDGLVQGPGSSLLSLGFDGSLDAIDPMTGQTTVVGPTGLGDCSTPVSPCGPNAANGIGLANGRYYVTDFANNLYSLDPKTAATKLIGATGVPGLPFPPFSENPDGSVNVFGEALFNARGKFYLYFAAIAVNFGTGTYAVQIPGAIYEINPATGQAKLLSHTESTLSAFIPLNDTVYAFNAWTGQTVEVDVTTGNTTAVADVDPNVGVVAGAAPARPAAPVVH